MLHIVVRHHHITHLHPIAHAPGNITAYTDIDFTAAQIDGVLAGEQFCLRVRRDTSVGSNATGDAELWVPGIQLVEV